MKTFQTILLGLILTTVVYAADEPSKPSVAVKDGIIQVFADNVENGVIGREQIGDKPLWVAGVRKNGKTRQVRITSRIGGRGAGKQLVRLRYPFGDASATWNMDVKREGDIVSVMIPWNGYLIGDIMDVNEGADKTASARQKLGLTAPDSKLPVMYSSGDSISTGYWPYLEAQLHGKVNLYYQCELAKDIPDIGLRNNGHAHLAYGVLQKAYKNQDFKPEYWLVNFGLHMINTHKDNLPAYGEWVEKFIAYAEQNKVNLIFVNTTPYRQSFRPKQNRTVLAFNELMKVAAEEHDIPVVDLHACTLAAIEEFGDNEVHTADGVHFTEDMKKRQAAFIAKRVREIVARGDGEQTGQSGEAKERATTPFTFVQMADPQITAANTARDVERFAKAIAKVNELQPDFVVICGDLVDAIEHERLFIEYKRIRDRLQVPCYEVAGNHDVAASTGDRTPTAEMLAYYREMIGPDFYSFEHKGFTFVAVNTQLWFLPVDGETEAHDAWLKKTLSNASNKGSPVFVLAHHAFKGFGHPYYGVPNPTRDEMLDLFGQHGVLAVLGGHLHRFLEEEHNGIKLVNAESCVHSNPPGFRLWHVGPHSIEHKLVELSME